MDKDSLLFDDKSFSDLLRDVYQNTKKKENQINTLIDQLKPLIRNMTDASLMVPLIKEYLEVSVKNDDNLVRLTAIIQRLLVVGSKTEKGDELGLTEAERKQLLEEAQSLVDNSK
jgi:predicted metalloprotease with PDZ domain